MEKVKLPKIVADRLTYVLGRYRSEGNAYMTLEMCGSDTGIDNWINDGNLIKLAQAIEFGYEVEEPEFKVGDWVYSERTKRAGEIDFVYDSGELSVVSFGHVSERYADEYLRHATPEEIAAEKKRRFWQYLDRNIDEYKAGDIVMVNDEYMVDEVARVHEHEITIKRMPGTFYKQYVRLVCPIESRMDVKG